jgi:class 3 adenylate cyclase
VTEERRLVTILFADVVGSTSLGETLDPEDVRALLGRLFAIAKDAVEGHGGRVEKFIGDAIMAVFGIPVAHDDDAARALSAALDLRDRVRADPALADRMAIRLGVNGGEVIATREQDASQFLVTGDPVNTAARLQQAADPWAILVGERTVRATNRRFEFGPPVAVEAKGKALPVPARPLIGPATSVASVPPRRIVGRESDLLQLDLAARRAFEERRPFLVSIVAPAGVGKSRLLEEFIGTRGTDVQVAIAQCLPYGQRLTYWPMRGIALSIVGLPDDASPDAVHDGVVAWLKAAGDPEPDRTGDQIAATLGAGDGEAADRLALFGAWRTLVELAAEQSPLVIVIEDLHWSSDSLLDLVEAMLQPRADVPLLMVALARPELLDRRPSWGGGRRNSISIALEPLPERAVAELVENLLEEPAPEIVRAVVERAEGNPFYAGEIVRSLSDRLPRGAAAEDVAAAIAALPDTVHATVLARLDALESVPRRVVQLGAVFGRSFQAHAIPALEPAIDGPVLGAALESLVERDLVRPGGSRGLIFRHILIREVAYGMLPRSERGRLHAAAGGWLEREAEASRREDELAELIAFHFREATTLGSVFGDAPPPDLSERAVKWLSRAADAAAAGAAGAEAARHLNAAIELAPQPSRPALYERLGQVWVGGDQALEAFDTAYELGRELGLDADQELRTLAQAVIVEARWIGSIGRRRSVADSEKRFERLRTLVETATSDSSRVLAYLGLAFGLTTVTNSPGPEVLAEGAEWARKGVELARRLEDPELISAALDAASGVTAGDDRAEDVLAFVAQRIAIGDRLTTGERVDSSIMAAWMHILLGNLDAGERYAAAARAGLGAGQAAAWSLGASAWRALALGVLGRWEEADVELGRAERSWQESEVRAPWFALSGILEGIAIARARLDPVGADHWKSAARTIFERSDPAIRTQRMVAYVDEDLAGLERAVVGEFRVFSGRFDYVYLALALLADRRHAVAPAQLAAIIDYCRPRNLRLVESQALRLRGIVQASAEDLEKALIDFTAMGARPLIARAKTEIGLLKGDDALLQIGLAELETLGDVEQAGRVAGEARARTAGQEPTWLRRVSIAG